MSYFIRAGIQLVDVERIQSVTLQDNGVLNVLVGEDTENGVIVVMSEEEARQSIFFRQFCNSFFTDSVANLRGSVNLPRETSSGSSKEPLVFTGIMHFSDKPDRNGDVLTKEAFESLKKQIAADFGPTCNCGASGPHKLMPFCSPVDSVARYIRSQVVSKAAADEDKAYLKLGKSQVSSETNEECTYCLSGENECNCGPEEACSDCPHEDDGDFCEEENCVYPKCDCLDEESDDQEEKEGKTELARLEKVVSDLKDEALVQNQNLANVQRKLTREKADLHIALNRKIEDHFREIADLRENHKREIAQLKETHAREIAELERRAVSNTKIRAFSLNPFLNQTGY